jgi:hypothetical protein
MPEIPQIPSGSPEASEMFFHVSPLSVLFHKEEPSPPLDKL